MKVLLNIDSLAPPRSGIGTYTFQLRNGLRQHASIAELLEFSRGQAVPGGGRVQKLARRALRRVPFAYSLRDRVSARLLRRSQMAREGYLYHEPNYVAVPYDGPLVITISDLSHLHYPQFHPDHRVHWLNEHLVESVRRAQAVICHSRYIRDEVVNLLGAPQDKVHVVYCGVDDDFRPRAKTECHDILQRYGLEHGRYLLSVGTLEPRKNLVGLILAYSRLPIDLRRKFPLVVAGAKGWRTGPIESAMRTLQAEGTLKWLDYVPLEDLPHLYSGATLFGYLSFYEGFGLPVIEAMASGVPVLTSDRSALPEIASGAAQLVDPEDLDAIAARIGHLLQDEASRGGLVNAGLQVSRRYRWESAVNETVSVYRQAIAAYKG